MSVSDDSSVTLVKMLPTSFKCFSISTLDADTFMVSTYDHKRPVRTIDVHGSEADFQHTLLPDKTYKLEQSACTYIPSTPGVAKSIVRVVRVVHLLPWTRNFFQLTCPWTSEKNLIFMCLFPNGSSQNRKFTNLFIFYFRNSDHSKSFTQCLT